MGKFNQKSPHSCAEKSDGVTLESLTEECVDTLLEEFDVGHFVGMFSMDFEEPNREKLSELIKLFLDRARHLK